MRWHVLTREKLIRTGYSDNYDPKWGRFKPSQRFNVDQSPLPFVIDKTRTYEKVPEKGLSKQHKVWISQPMAGLDKRQCSLQVVVRPEGLQPKLGIIFRGKGNIREEERACYHENVDVYFQAKAWADTAVSVDWVKKTLSKVVDKEDCFVLFLDNLTAQCSDEFKEAVASQGGIVWYFPVNTIDITQTLDSGYTQTLKNKICQAQERWFEDEENANKWFSNESKFSARKM